MQKTGGEPPPRPKRTSRAGRKKHMKNDSRPATSEPRTEVRGQPPPAQHFSLGTTMTIYSAGTGGLDADTLSVECLLDGNSDVNNSRRKNRRNRCRADTG